MRSNARVVVVVLASLLVVSSAMLGANAASADSIQVQSYQRASQTQACAAEPGETPWQTSWGSDSSWHPSWEQWANDGNGGWTCTRSITWARDSSSSCATGGPCALGDIGPGGGLVFLISGGLRYEMAPKTWDAIDSTGIDWCSEPRSNITGALGTVVGTGSANTNAVQSPACTSGAGVSASAYRGGGLTDWFLPSKDELNAMCNYSHNPTAPAAPSVSCSGGSGSTQDGTFAGGAYGFAYYYYWSSSQRGVGGQAEEAWRQDMSTGRQNSTTKHDSYLARPIRAF